jgi:hypothetical protein
MSRTLRSTAIVSVLAVVFVLAAAPAVSADDWSRHRCSNRSVAGPFGYTSTGTRVGIGPVAGVGVLTFDRNGNVTDGKQTVSFGGTIAEETYSGTYSVNPDCTGSVTVDVLSSIPAFNRTTTFDLVWVDDSNSARAMFTNAATIITADARRLFPRGD